MKKSKRITLLVTFSCLSNLISVFADSDFLTSNIIDGIKIGDNTTAQGIGSIATGRNSIAVGTHAVATGGNENLKTLKQLKQENHAKVDEISNLQQQSENLTQEISTIRNSNINNIKKGIQAESLQQTKKSAEQHWQAKEASYQQALSESQQYLQDAQNKLDNLNERLNSISQLQDVDINSDTSLTKAAITFKSIVENGLSVNLSDEFYKNYLKTYYQNLGELRQANFIYSEAENTESYSASTLALKNLHLISDWNSFTDGHNSASLTSIGVIGAQGDMKHFAMGDTGKFIAFSYDPSTSNLTYNHNGYSITLKNIENDITSETEYTQWQQTKEAAKKDYITQFLKIGNGLYKIDDDLSAKEFFAKQQSLKLDVIDKNYDITYDQWKYEQTHDTAWLNKKQQALNDREKIIQQYNSLNYNDYDSTLPTNYGMSSKLTSVTDYFRAKDSEYKQTHITDIQEQRTITTNTLTSELEKALNVSKEVILNKQKELVDLKKEAEQAKKNYEAIQVSQSDYEAAQKYQNIKNEIEQKTQELKNYQDRITALQQSISYKDLSNVGENAMAYGTDSLASGSNSLAIGTNSVVTGENSISIGIGSIVTGKDSIGIGTGNMVLGNNSGAFGDPNTIYGQGSYAIGNNNTIGNTSTNAGQNTFILGNNISTTANNAVILGNNSSTDEDNVVSVGSSQNQRRIVNVAPGTKGTDAATVAQTNTLSSNDGSIKITPSLNTNGSTRYDLSILMNSIAKDLTVGGNASVAGTVTAKTIIADNAVIGGHSIIDEFNQQRRDIDRVGAGAAALAALQYLPYEDGSKLVGGVGYGHYRGKNAGAVGLRYYPNRDIAFSMASTVGNGDNMLNAGLSFRIGNGVSRYDHEIDIKKALQESQIANHQLASKLEQVEQENQQLMKRLAALEAKIK